jgi:carboxypeptidase PM20D1
VASIVTAEKGYVSFRLTARAAGGHSSMPPRQTVVGQLARAVARVQASPMRARLVSPVTDMLDRLAPELPFGQRLLFVNRWLFKPLLLARLSRAPYTDALIRTTTAPTVFHAGIKDNVLPSEAHAVINFRLLPGDSGRAVQDHLRAAMADDDIEIAIEDGPVSEASPVSTTDSVAFRLLERTINEVFPDALVTPGLNVGATDSRHYTDVIEARYNIRPVRLSLEDLPRIHGTDERTSVQGYADVVRFYVRLMQSAAG